MLASTRHAVQLVLRIRIYFVSILVTIIWLLFSPCVPRVFFSSVRYQSVPHCVQQARVPAPALPHVNRKKPTRMRVEKSETASHSLPMAKCRAVLFYIVFLAYHRVSFTGPQCALPISVIFSSSSYVLHELSQLLSSVFKAFCISDHTKL